jgi:hypothetical protein
LDRPRKIREASPPQQLPAYTASLGEVDEVEREKDACVRRTPRAAIGTSDAMTAAAIRQDRHPAHWNRR